MTTSLGQRVRSIRQRAGLSATALAGDHLSVATVSRIEHGSIEPSLATLRYLATRLGCPVAALLLDEDNDGAIPAALEEVEAWLLLGRPQLAWERVMAAQDTLRAVPSVPQAVHEESSPARHLRWAVARASALLDQDAAPALDLFITEARRRGDVWAMAALVQVRTLTLEPEPALVLLQTALRGLPPITADTPQQQLLRAGLSLLLAQRFEGGGEIETARALYTATVSMSDPYRQPAGLAQRLLRAPRAARGASPAPHLAVVDAAEHRVELPAASALALVVAAARLWRAAMVDLARLDVQARRLAEAARRLRDVYAGSGGGTELAVLGGLWSTLDSTMEAKKESAGGRLPDLRPLISTGEVPAPVADDLVRLEIALLAGRLAEGEQIGALLATAIAEDAPALGHAIWLRVALAWAEAGNAPRAARALRAAGLAG